MHKKSIADYHREIIPHQESPAFTAEFPKVINQDLIPANALKAMSPGWASGVHAARPVNVVTLFDVYITAEGLVFDADGNVVSESITQYLEPDIDRARERVLSAKDISPEWSKAILLRKRGDGNYGHWFVEALPRLWAAQNCTTLEACVIPKREGAMADVMKCALALSGFDQRIIEHSDSDVLWFKQLVIVDGLSVHGTYMSPLVFSKTDLIAPPREQTKKIFVSRRGAPRDLAEEASVVKALATYGFEMVHPGYLTLQEQIDTFASASHVVGVMGAGMTNIMFCSPGTKIINLAPAEFPDTFFYFIAVHRNLAYTEIRGKNIDGVEGWDSLFSVPPAQIIAALSLEQQC